MFFAKYSKLLLSFLMIVAIVFFWYTRFDELIYHSFASKELIDLSNAQELNRETQEKYFNKFVSITGVLGNKAATLNGLRSGSLRYGRYQVRNLIGSKVFIEFDEEKYLPKFSQFTKVTVQGRFVPFGTAKELSSVREFYQKYHKMTIDKDAVIIIVDEFPKTQWRYLIAFILTLIIVSISFYTAYRSIKNYSIVDDCL